MILFVFSSFCIEFKSFPILIGLLMVLSGKFFFPANYGRFQGLILAIGIGCLACVLAIIYHLMFSRSKLIKE
jgi:hypothetical protein